MSRFQEPADPHSVHDQVLVAAFVADDLEGSEAEAARDLLSSCRQCAELAADLVVITAAVRDLPVLSRPRDFRISAEQASALHRRGVLRFLPAGGRGLGFARPLGSGLAALGVAGLLFTSLMGSQMAVILSNVGSSVGGGAQGYAAPGAPEAARTNGADTASKAATPAPSAAASAAAAPSPIASPAAAPSAAASAAAASSPIASPAAASSAAASAAASAGEGDTRNPASIPPGPLPGQPSPTSMAPALPPSTPPPATAGTPAAGTSTAGAGAPSQGGIPLLPAASVAALLAGLGLLGADLVVRRR